MLPRLALALVYLTINAVFVLKYGGRFLAHGPLLVALYLVAVTTGFWLGSRLPLRIFSIRTYAAVVIVLAMLMGIVFLIIPQESLRVDRYEMIRLFWDNAFAGINPYTPRAVITNIPSAFPFYFICALPFYFCKEIGLFSLAGFLLFSFLLYRSSADMRARALALLLLAGSPAFAWEVSCRSTIFLNMVLVVGLVLSMERRSAAGFSNRASIIYGLFTGLVACTRSVTILVLASYLVYLWRNHRAPRLLPYIASAIIAFAIPFVPFAAYPSFFLGWNPFAVQASILPGPAPALAALIACAAALRLRSFSGFVLLQAVCLFAVALAYAGTQIALSGWQPALSGDRVDLSYFLFAFPFVFIGIAAGWFPPPTTAVSGQAAAAGLHE